MFETYFTGALNPQECAREVDLRTATQWMPHKHACMGLATLTRTVMIFLGSAASGTVAPVSPALRHRAASAFRKVLFG